eukprot:jgi/Picsp_1/3061/NSC_01283-R1_hypothetical protein CHLNCDRAFT_138884 [Chlorella variabilis]
MEMIRARLQAYPQPCKCTVVPAGLHVSMVNSHSRQFKMTKYNIRRDRGLEVWRSVKEGAADSKMPSSNYATSIEVIKGTRISFKELASVASLLASVFGDPSNSRDLLRGYQIRLMAALQSRILSEQSCFTLVCARVREDGDRAAEQIVGVMTISPGLEASGAKGYDGLEDKKCMSVCNMAVDEMYRKRGIAQRMLKAGETVVKGLQDGKRLIMVLSVAKYNTEAITLYGKCGFVVDENWEDPRWLESVSGGRVDVERRILMVKRLDTNDT